jgi:hypothetical protein
MAKCGESERCLAAVLGQQRHHITGTINVDVVGVVEAMPLDIIRRGAEMEGEAIEQHRRNAGRGIKALTIMV